jgi:thioredoxin-dependent peroxiredoxin
VSETLYFVLFLESTEKQNEKQKSKNSPLFSKMKKKSQPDYYRVLKADEGCTKEMCSIRDSWSSLTATKAAVFGISGDEPAKNAAFRAANNLPFKLLSDSGNFLRKSFGIKGDLLGLLPG